MPDSPPASAPPTPIFLSYASEDAAAARRIAAALGQAGLTVWFDQSELRGGDAWDQRIRRQIKECALFMPVISAHTQARTEGYFRLEWHLAEQRSYLMAQSRAFIVPVVVDATPDANALVPDRFRERQWTRLPEGHVPFDFAPRVAQLLGIAGPGLRPRPPEVPATAPVPASERSVAVLAFTNLSKDEENEYFSEGMSDELLTVLQNVPGLRVAARTSAFSFKGKNASVREVGSQLEVAHLVEGGVQKSGNRVRVAARLTSVATGVVKWSRSYTREIRDVFALQEELALAIVGELRGQLEGHDVTQVQQANRGGSRVPAAYESYLLGKHIHAQMSESTAAQGVVHLRRATQLDPGFALAWLALASAQIWIVGFMTGCTREEFETMLAEGRQALERSLSLAPDLPAALGIRGYIALMFDRDVKAARAALRRAEEIGPNDPEVVLLSTNLLYLTPTAAEAVEPVRQLVARDPMNARTHARLCWVLAQAGQFEEAQVQARQFRAMAPTAAMADSALAYVLLMQGRYAEAEQELDLSSRNWPQVWKRIMVFHGLGRTAESDAILAGFIQTEGATAAVQVAEAYAMKGEADSAFQWLETSRQQRDPGLFQVYHSVFFRPFQKDPRWADFWQQFGIEPTAGA